MIVFFFLMMCTCTHRSWERLWYERTLLSKETTTTTQGVGCVSLNSWQPLSLRQLRSAPSSNHTQTLPKPFSPFLLMVLLLFSTLCTPSYPFSLHTHTRNKEEEKRLTSFYSLFLQNPLTVSNAHGPLLQAMPL